MSPKLTTPPPSKHRLAIDAKVVLLGETTVGKSSLIVRFVQGRFTDNVEMTIGGAFSSKVIELENHSVKLHIWDTSGQERFHALAPMYYRGAKAAIVVYDITSAESLEKAMTWTETLREKGPENVIVFLAANKLDLAKDHRGVPKQCGQEWAEFNKVMFAEVSAKTGQGVKDIFISLAEKIALQNNGRQQRQRKTLEYYTSGSRSCAC